MKKQKRYLLYIAYLLLHVNTVIAEQNLPVMNTLPRWDHGFGFQANYEYHEKTKIYQKNNLLNNINKDFEEIHEFNMQGVFTFSKEYRLLLEIPWQKQIRGQIDQTNNQQQSSHIGEISLGGAIKKYYNAQGQAASIGMAPLFHWSNNSQRFKQTDFGASLIFLGDIETYYFLGIARLESKISFPQSSTNFILEETIFIREGYHVFHVNSMNIGSWVSLGIQGEYIYFRENLNASIFLYPGFSLEIVPNVMIYWNNYLLHVVLSIPIYRYSKNQGLSEDWRILVSMGGAFIY